MTLDAETKILIVGLGQLGGAYARGFSEKGFEVGAIDICDASIAFALERGWIAHGRTTNDPEYIGSFDLIVSALYPHTFINWIKENQQYIRTGALITDVTGVKGSVVYPVQDMLRGDLEYIPAHPMAGRETSGVQNSDKTIFSGANYLITPTEKNTPEAIEVCRSIAELLGFGKISVISPDRHDMIIGFLSQLTHCIAVSLMICNDSDELVNFTGDSFRDLTRIAKINEDMWSELFMMNREKLLCEMKRFSDSFDKLRQSIENGDVETMKEYMRLSTARRKKFEEKKAK